MSKKIKYIGILIIFIYLLIPTKCYTNVSNIQFINNQTSVKEIITYKNNKSMLTKTWYTYQFELNLNEDTEYKKIYPVNINKYKQAIEEVNYNLDKIGDYKIYFLDYKLKNYPSYLGVSFKDNSTVIFASYYKLSDEKIHQLAVHELGHQIDFKLMNKKTWQKYIKLRGLTNTKIYNNKSLIHENRPQEIFAEDFRLLFGSEKIKNHLNQNLPDLDSVPGLKEFFLSLS